VRKDAAMERRGQARPDVSLLDGVVASPVLEAARAVDRRLKELGIRHVLVGGLAVGAHGFPRATKAVDFLVGPEAFEHHAGGFVTARPGLPVAFANNVIVDYLLPRDDEQFLIDESFEDEGVAPITVLVYLKLKSPRAKDRADIVELIKAGIDQKRVTAFLDAHAPALRASFDEAVTTARAEEE